MIVSFDRPASTSSTALRPRRQVARPGGGAVAYVEAGEGEPVVLIHGALTNLDDMVIGPFDALARNHRVIAVDRPGHGESSRVRLADASPWRQAEVIHDAVQALGVERPVVVGHSFGGAVALAYAMRFPGELAGAVTLAPIVWPEPRLELAAFGPRAWPGVGDAAAWCGSATSDQVGLPLLWRAMFLPQMMPERFVRDFSFERAGDVETTRSTGEDALAIVTALWRSVAGYASCRTPVTILAGDADMVVNTFTHARMLAKVLPDARLDLLPGLGHMLHHFAVERVVQAVADMGARPQAQALAAASPAG